MIIKSKEFQEAANTILLAIAADTKNITNLELYATGHSLYLSVTNREYYVSVKFPLETEEDFRAVVNASLFLTLVSSITTDTFELNIKTNAVVIKSGKSTYKAPMIYKNDALITLPTIYLTNKTVEMPISNDVLDSILKVNSREIAKVKNIDINELQRLYYVDETGCFTFTTGACVNSFSLAKPIKLILNDRVVHLFKLFKEDVNFSFGYDTLPDNSIQAKAVFETSNIYVAVLITCDDLLIARLKTPCDLTKKLINESYANSLVLSSSTLLAAVTRLLTFAKNSGEDVSFKAVAKISLAPSELTITDKLGNTEVITIEASSNFDDSYEFAVNLIDLKFVLDSCKNDHITMNFGNHKSIVITRGTICNVISEERAD